MKAFCRFCLIFLMFSTLLRPAETEGASLTRIRAGYPSPSATFYPLFAAKEAGLRGKIWLRYRNDLRPGRAIDPGPRIGTVGFFDDLCRGLSPGIGGGRGSHTSGKLHRQPADETDGPPVHLKARRPQREDDRGHPFRLSHGPARPPAAQEEGIGAHEGCEPHPDRPDAR